MLITTRDEQQNKINAMTASWGALGVLWNKPVAICFVRPQRYTYGLAEQSERFSLCFFDEKYRDALKLCGTKSGRDIDKVKATGLTECRSNESGVFFAEAKHVILARKLYADDLRTECFIDRAPLAFYEKNDFHRMYICEIEKVLTKFS